MPKMKIPSVGSLPPIPHIPGTVNFSTSPLKIRPEHIRIIKEAFKKRLGSKFELPSIGGLKYTMPGKMK